MSRNLQFDRTREREAENQWRIKIRVRPKETVSEIDKNGYFRRQPNHFTTPFGDGENDLKAEGNKRYRLVWAKLCHWSNRAAIVRELEGLEDPISACT